MVIDYARECFALGFDPTGFNTAGLTPLGLTPLGMPILSGPVIPKSAVLRRNPPPEARIALQAVGASSPVVAGYAALTRPTDLHFWRRRKGDRHVHLALSSTALWTPCLLHFLRLTSVRFGGHCSVVRRTSSNRRVRRVFDFCGQRRAHSPAAGALRRRGVWALRHPDIPPPARVCLQPR